MELSKGGGVAQMEIRTVILLLLLIIETLMVIFDEISMRALGIYFKKIGKLPSREEIEACVKESFKIGNKK